MFVVFKQQTTNNKQQTRLVFLFSLNKNYETRFLVVFSLSLFNPGHNLSLDDDLSLIFLKKNNDCQKNRDVSFKNKIFKPTKRKEEV